MTYNNQYLKKEGQGVFGIGSPLLDIVINVTDEQLADLHFVKGSMSLISDEQSCEIMDFIEHLPKDLLPGGSAANTLSGVSALGNRAAFQGAVGADDYGRIFSDQTASEGVLAYLQTEEFKLTGHSYIFITPDGERTMATHLGAALAFNKSQIDETEIANSKILHIEAYQLEDKKLAEALLHAIEIAKRHGVKVSLDLSDASLIRRNHELFKQVVKDHIDILFANETEAHAFTGKTEREALDEMAKHCDIAVVKLGDRGSLLKAGDEVVEIEAQSVPMVNTNGAGDIYAAGILHGLVNDLDLRTAGEIASHVAGLVVSSSGARLNEDHQFEIAKYKQ